jgi:GH25 family lysozyme M1 (1,4-beta-N-acetylmuramidase)
MNFAGLKAHAQYAYLRYGYGDGWEDPKLATYYNDAKANDFPIGGYWFDYIGKDPQKHAQGFADLLRKYPPTLDEVEDAETSTLSPGASLEWMKATDTQLKGLTNKIPKIYTAPGIWNGIIARSSYWIGRKLWDATWTTALAPTIPFDFTMGWEDWQHSADGNRKAAEYGSTLGDADMDLNRFNGTITAFNSRYGTHIQPIGSIVVPPVVVPPVVVPPGTIPEYVIITAGELSIRNAPNLSAGVIGHALLNTKWYPLELVTTDIPWYRVGKNAFISKGYTRYP